jgi:HPt (histidine-containing phosphotransfer) domain-containing protein
MSSPSPLPSDSGASRFLPAASLAHTDLVPPAGGYDLPLVDKAVLQELEEQLDGPVVALRFARDYTDMWEQRFRRLAAALARQDRAAAMDAVISLKISSAMVGGLRLAWLAEQLEHLIRHDDYDGGHTVLADVADHGGQTVRELRGIYLQVND